MLAVDGRPRRSDRRLPTTGTEASRSGTTLLILGSVVPGRLAVDLIEDTLGRVVAALDYPYAVPFHHGLNRSNLVPLNLYGPCSCVPSQRTPWSSL